MYNRRYAVLIAGLIPMLVAATCNGPVQIPIKSIVVTPSPTTCAIGGTQQFAAVAKDASNASTNPQPTFTFTSSNSGVASINAASGLVNCLTAGTATITASASTATGVMTSEPGAALTVEATPTDTLPPTLLSSTPQNNAINVARTTKVVFNFSEPINTSRLVVAFCKPGSICAPPPFILAWSDSDKTLTISINYESGSAYRVILQNIFDKAGNQNAPIDGSRDGPRDIELAFTVADFQAPTVVSASPDAIAIGMPQDTVFKINFSEPMDRTSVQTAFNVNLTNGGPITGTFSWSANDQTMTFAPSAPLPFGENINWALKPGAKDTAGNALQGSLDRIMRVIQQKTVSLSLYGGGYIVHACNNLATSCDDTAYIQTTINVGDRSLTGGSRPIEYARGYLAFNILDIPVSASVASARLQIVFKRAAGDPFGTLGLLNLERVSPVQNVTGAYNLSGARGDFSLPALGCTGCPVQLSSSSVNADVTGFVQNDLLEHNTTSQFRLRFSNEYSNNDTSDFIDFERQAALTVTYQFP